MHTYALRYNRKTCMHRHRHIQSHTVAQTHTRTNIHRKTDRHTHACRSEADLLSDREASIPTRTWSFSWLRWRYINLCEKKDDTYRRRSSNAEALYSIRSIGHVQLRHLSVPSSPLTRGRRFVMGASAEVRARAARQSSCLSAVLPLSATRFCCSLLYKWVLCDV